jgi:hypothetical protein
MIQPGRNYNAGGYRYGFNGQEKSTEINADGNSTTAEYWEYDSRIGRRWNVDPVVKAWISGYACFADNPIFYSDVNGDDPEKETPEKDIAGTQKLGDVVVKTTTHRKEEGEKAKKSGFRSSIFKDITWGRPEDPRDLYPGDPWLQRQFVTGQMNGHNAAIIVGSVLQRGGEITTAIGEDGAVLAGPETAGLGSAIGIAVAFAGTGIKAYGATVQIKASAGAIAAGVMLHMLEANGNPQTNGSDAGSGSSSSSTSDEVTKETENIFKDAKKMSPDDIGEFLGEGKNWHKTKAKSNFLNFFKKELKGDTNADFYVDKITKEVYLKSNKSGNWIKTGQKF